MMKKEFTCVVCPVGCSLKVEQDDSGQVTVTGNRCKRGIEYGTNELTDPRRVVTSTVRVNGGLETVTSVKTETGIPKGRIMELMGMLNRVEVQAPCAEGTVVIPNVFGEGNNVVVTREVFKA